IALLADGPLGRLTETAIGHLLVVKGGVVCAPPRGTVLDGISLRVVEELCAEGGIPFAEAPLSLTDCASAGEAMLCGTAFCLAGVGWLEGIPLPWRGPITQRLLSAWSAQVGVDIAGQMGSPSTPAGAAAATR